MRSTGSERRMAELSDKKVAIIGTGATAVQAVPFLGKYSKHLYVFQRTPSSIDERRNHLTDPEWAKTLTPGWQQRRAKNFHTGTFSAFERSLMTMIAATAAAATASAARKMTLAVRASDPHPATR